MAPETQPVTPDPSTAVPAATSTSAIPDQTVSNPTPQSVPQPNATDANAPAYPPGSNVSSATGQQVPQNAAPAAPVPHARLLAMVRGLSAGLETAGATMSAVGKSIATHGKEGGAPDVQEFVAKQQQMKLQTQQAAIAAKDADLRQQLMVGQIAETQGNIARLNGTLKSDLTKADAEAKGAQQTVIGQAQDIRTKALQDFMMTGDLAAYNDTLSKLGGTAAPTGTAPAAGGAGGTVTGGSTTAAGGTSSAGGIPPVAVASWKNSVDAASNAYPNDPTIKQYAAIMTDPNADPKQMALAANGAKNRMAALDAGTKSRTEQEAAETGSIVGKLSTPEALAAPGAQAAIQARIADPTTNPADLPRLRALLPQAAVAQHNILMQKQREDQIQQTVAQGDPDIAGKLLADRTATIDELKLRNATPQFIESAIKSAQKDDPTFKAPEAAAQAKIAGSPANQQFFGNTDSLLVKGGTLDQLNSAGEALGNGPLPPLNTITNATKAALGQGPQAQFAAAALGVADDYSKVMTGGQGSDTSRQQALYIIAAQQSPAQRQAAIDQIRQQIESQRNGRVGTNPYLKSMYPDPIISRHAIGDTVTLKNGQKVVIKSIDRDGNFTY